MGTLTIISSDPEIQPIIVTGENTLNQVLTPHQFLNKLNTNVEGNINYKTRKKVKETLKTNQLFKQCLENAALTDAYYALDYTRYFIQTRWEPAEPIILNNKHASTTILEYVKITKKRWIEAEKYLIANNVFLLSDYCNSIKDKTPINNLANYTDLLRQQLSEEFKSLLTIKSSEKPQKIYAYFMIKKITKIKRYDNIITSTIKSLRKKKMRSHLTPWGQ